MRTSLPLSEGMKAGSKPASQILQRTALKIHTQPREKQSLLYLKGKPINHPLASQDNQNKSDLHLVTLLERDPKTLDHQDFRFLMTLALKEMDTINTLLKGILAAAAEQPAIKAAS